MSGAWEVRVGRSGDSEHPIPFCSIPSHLVASHCIPLHPIPFPVARVTPRAQPKHEPCFQVNIGFFSSCFSLFLRVVFLLARSPLSPPSTPFNLSKHFISHKYTRMSLDQSE